MYQFLQSPSKAKNCFNGKIPETLIYIATELDWQQLSFEAKLFQSMNSIL